MRTLMCKVKELIAFWKKIWAKEIAASLALYFIMGFVPGMCLLSFVCADKFSLDIVKDAVFFKGFYTLFLRLEASAKSAVGKGGVFFAIVTVYSSLNLFYRFLRCGEMLYDYKGSGGVVKKRLISFMFLAITVTALSMAGALYVGIRATIDGLFLNVIAIIVLSVIAFTVLLFLNLLVCPFKIRIKDVIIGCLFTFLLWVIVSVGFYVYLEFFADYERLYGVFGALFALFLFVYFLMQAFTFGVAINIRRIEEVKSLNKS